MQLIWFGFMKRINRGGQEEYLECIPTKKLIKHSKQGI